VSPFAFLSDLLEYVGESDTRDTVDTSAFVLVIALARDGLLHRHIVVAVCLCWLFLLYYFSSIMKYLVWNILSCADIISVSVSSFRSPLDSHSDVTSSLSSSLSIIIYQWPCIRWHLYYFPYSYLSVICLLTYFLLTYLFLEKLTGLQLVKNFPPFYRTRRFFTAFTSARQLSLSWAS
jgi:hypothetical protein